MNKISLFSLTMIAFSILVGCIETSPDKESIRINSDVSVLLYDDNFNRLFVGTEENGLFIYYPLEDKWIHRTIEDGLPTNDIYCLAYDEVSNTLFMGTRGLTIYNLAEDIFINLDEDDGLLPDDIYSLDLNPNQNELYFGYGNSGLSIYCIGNGSLTSYDVSNTDSMGEGLPHNSILAMVFDDYSGNIILGAHRYISIFNPINRTFLNFNASEEPLEGLKSIKSISFDEQNRVIYIGTTHNAIWSFDLETHTFDHFDITDFEVLSLIIEINSQVLYIGAHGLRIMDLETNEIVEKTTEHGLPSFAVQALALDTESSKLYIGTNNGPGLTIYNISEDSFQTIK